MRLALGFRNKLAANLDVQEGKYSLYPVRQQFDQMKARIVAGWNIDHKPDGHHGDVVADTVTCDSATIDDLVIDADGITFPSTAIAASGARTLYDFRTGSWTPVIGGAGGTSGQAYSVQQGRYVKVGGLVWVKFTVTLSTEGTITGDAQIQGLPFTQVNESSIGGVVIGNFASLATNWIWVGGTGVANSTAIAILGRQSAGASATALTAADIGDTSRLDGSFLYQV